MLFIRFGDHRDLHSFPTRRSSDLPDRSTCSVSTPAGTVHEYTPGVSNRAEPVCAACAAVGVTAAKPANHADRKSTRLNSSHSSISYAVFCLKKIKHLEVHTLLTLT